MEDGHDDDSASGAWRPVPPPAGDEAVAGLMDLSDHRDLSCFAGNPGGGGPDDDTRHQHGEGVDTGVMAMMMDLAVPTNTTSYSSSYSQADRTTATVDVAATTAVGTGLALPPLVADDPMLPDVGSASGTGAEVSLARQSVLLSQLRRRRQAMLLAGGGETWPLAAQQVLQVAGASDREEIEAWLLRQLQEALRRKSDRWGIDFAADPSERVMAVASSLTDEELLQAVTHAADGEGALDHLVRPPHLVPRHHQMMQEFHHPGLRHSMAASDRDDPMNSSPSRLTTAPTHTSHSSEWSVVNSSSRSTPFNANATHKPSSSPSTSSSSSSTSPSFGRYDSPSS